MIKGCFVLAPLFLLAAMIGWYAVRRYRHFYDVSSGSSGLSCLFVVLCSVCVVCSVSLGVLVLVRPEVVGTTTDLLWTAIGECGRQKVQDWVSSLSGCCYFLMGYLRHHSYS